MTLAPGTRLGPYEIVGRIGAGGMGEVYRAHDSRLGRDVAIKVLPAHLSASPEARARFEREARAISQFTHPHICTLHDIGRQGDTDYLVMELLEGETLARRLESGPLPLRDILRHGIEIAHALDLAHRRGIVHRDLKPGNVMLTKGGAKLMDFGIARATARTSVAGAPTGSPTVSRALTADGMIVGTLQYMAPEQLEGRKADARSDLWALGCVLYEMATGKRAFEGTSQASVIAAVLDREPPAITTLQPLTPPALERIVKRCLAKDPDERFQSALDLAFDLEGMLGAGVASPAVGADGVHAGRRLSIGTFLGVGLAFALLVAGSSFLLGRRTAPAPEPPRFTRLTFQRGRIGNARFAPDGKNVLYSAAWDGRAPEVFETRADLSTTRSLGLSGIRLHAVSRTGELAVKRDVQGAGWGYKPLAVLPTTGSAPRDLLDGVSEADWAADGRTLAVVRRIGGEDRIEMPPGQVLARTAGEFGDLRISPDGRSMVAVEHPVVGDTRGAIVVVNLAGEKTTVSNEFASIRGAAWSRDGREIWFSAEAAGMRENLYATTVRGRLRCVARFPSKTVLLDLAPDGRVLLATETSQAGIRGRSYEGSAERELGWLDWPIPKALVADGTMLLLNDSGETAGANYAVYLRKMDGSPPVRLGEGSGLAVSPDGRWVLAVHFGPPSRLLMIPTGPGETVTLPQGQVETYQDARWFPDGRRIVFVGAERGRPQRTWIQEAPDGLPRAVTPEGVVGVTTSPDGNWVATVTLDLALVIFPLRGGGSRSVAQLTTEEKVCEWSADGRTIFVGRAGGRLDVLGIDVRSGERRPWKTFEVPDPAGVSVWTAILTRDARSYAFGYVRHLDELYLVEGLR